MASDHGGHPGPSSASGIFKAPDGTTIEIRDIEIVDKPISPALHFGILLFQDTEFPGVVARPVGDVGDLHYQTLRCNVDMLKLIQLGLTLVDSEGNFVPGCTCWQFNFKFSLS
eukprot:gene41553-50710_t